MHQVQGVADAYFEAQPADWDGIIPSENTQPPEPIRDAQAFAHKLFEELLASSDLPETPLANLDSSSGGSATSLQQTPVGGSAREWILTLY